MMMALDAQSRAAALAAQRNELTEHVVYGRLAARSSGENRKLLERIAKDELKHHDFWKKLTGVEVRPKRLVILCYTFLASTLGVVFAMRLMERGEDLAQQNYAKLLKIPGVAGLIADEERHEQELLGMLKEDILEYAGSIVLGLNDALVELTGALAGMTLAVQNHTIVAIAGLVTGVAASLSMAASEFLSSEEEGHADAGTSAIYTGLAYIVVVALLIAPYFLFANIFVSLAVTLTIAVLVIAGYTFYITVAKNQAFWPRFLKMALISLGVAAISFGVGFVLNRVLGVSA